MVITLINRHLDGMKDRWALSRSFGLDTSPLNGFMVNEAASRKWPDLHCNPCSSYWPSLSLEQMATKR